MLIENKFFEEIFKKYTMIPVTKEKSLDSNWERSFEDKLSWEKIRFNKQKKIGPYIIDFFVEPNICINIDGPSHFIGDSKLYKSKDILRDKFLNLMKFKVISIPFFKWKRGNEENEQIKIIKSYIK